MTAAVEDHMLPDLVADGDQVVADAGAGQGRDLVGVEGAGGRIVGIVEDDHPGARGDRGLDGVFGQAPQRRLEADRDGDAAGALDQGAVGVVGGLEDDHLVARMDVGHDGGGDGLGRAGGDQDAVEGQGDALEPAVVFDDGVAQLGRPREGAYWLEPVIRASAARRRSSSGP